jgi:hypothetical protein
VFESLQQHQKTSTWPGCMPGQVGSEPQLYAVADFPADSWRLAISTPAGSFHYDPVPLGKHPVLGRIDRLAVEP